MNINALFDALQVLDTHLIDFALYADGKITERRFTPANRCNDCYSVAKVFTLTALGLLWDEGKLDTDAALAEYFEDELSVDRADARWKQVHVEHVIRHTTGIDEGFLDIDVEDAAAYPDDDWLNLVFSHPLVHAPGSHTQYSDAAYYLLSRLCARLAGENMDALLYRRVFKPLGFSESAWSRCPLGHPIGATGLYISARDMVKLGAVYASGGLWNGQRLLSEAWCRRVRERGYEFHEIAPGVYLKGGMYGQGLCFSDSGNFAAAWHSFEEDPPPASQPAELLKRLLQS